MIHSDENLDHLSDLLNDIPPDQDGMTLAEFDGYVAGLLVCPEMIMTTKWWSPIWGGTGALRNIKGFEEIIQAAMAHYNRVGETLMSDPDLYEPIYGADPNSDDLLWEPWISGFERAMRLRPNAWERIIESDDEEAASSLGMIIIMNEFYEGEFELDEDAIDEIGPDLIPQMVRTLNDWTKSYHAREALRNVNPLTGKPRIPYRFRVTTVRRSITCTFGFGRNYRRYRKKK